MDMIKTIHRKFILIATVSIFMIVAVALSVINGTLYMMVRGEIHTVLDYISDGGGTLAGERLPAAQQGWLADGSWSDDTPEFMYQTRYFSVLLDRDGTAKLINVNHIAAFTAKEAVTTAIEACQSGETEGFFKKDKASYAYKMTAKSDGDLLIVILDCTRDLAAVNAFLRYSSLFGLLCILLFIAIVTILSKRVIRPFQRNVENQKRFITNAGHELKTPIAIISANAEALELISGKNEWTGNILKQVHRLSGLINDMILLAKVGEATEKDIHLTDVDFTRCVTSGADSFRQLITDQGKQFEEHIGQGIRAKADARFVSELVSIFLDNAAKYCDAGGTVSVSLSKRKNGKGAVITVSNHYKEGKGVDYSRFFERFYRGDTSHNSSQAGYGIGLSMAADMVKLMRGTIGVTYKEGIISFKVEIG